MSKVYGSTYGAWQTLLSLPIARKDEIQRTMSDCPQETLESNRDKTCDDTSYFIARNEMSGFVMFCHTYAPKNAAIPALFFFFVRNGPYLLASSIVARIYFRFASPTRGNF